jgi:hypothetical protein
VPTNDSAHEAGAIEQAESLLRLLVDSETFRAAPVMRSLLLYLWQHKSESISEYAVAVHALGRPSDFDPKTDATVRVQVARLRAKLKEFYERELPSFPLRLSIPLGGHEVEWAHVASVSSVETSGFVQLPRFYRGVVIGSVLAGTLLSILCVVLVFWNRNLKASLPALPPQPRFWRTFLADGKGATIVLPNPLFFRWSSNPNILVRDVRVSEFQDWPSSDFIRQLSEKWGPPTLNQIYVPVLQLKAAVKLFQHMEDLGQHPELTDSPNLPAESAGAKNTIFLGIPRYYPTGHRVTQILEKMNFSVIGYEPTVIKNKNPRQGEAAEYREADYSTEHKVVPELIILLPAMSNGARTLVLLGSNAMAFTSMLVAPEGLKVLEKYWSDAGSPDSWELLIQAEVNGETVLRVTPQAIHAIASNFWN